MVECLCDLWQDHDGTQWYLQTCPWYLIGSPGVVECITAHKWYQQNQLSIRYPDAPIVLLDAVTAYDNGFHRGRAALREREQKERDRKHPMPGK